MAKKALLFVDFEAEEHILDSLHPKACRALGYQVKGFSGEIWDSIKYDTSCAAALPNFSGNPELWCTDNLLGFALMETRDMLRKRCRYNMSEIVRMDNSTQWPDTERIQKALGVTRGTAWFGFRTWI